MLQYNNGDLQKEIKKENTIRFIFFMGLYVCAIFIINGMYNTINNLDRLSYYEDHLEAIVIQKEKTAVIKKNAEELYQEIEDTLIEEADYYKENPDKAKEAYDIQDEVSRIIFEINEWEDDVKETEEICMAYAALYRSYYYKGIRQTVLGVVMLIGTLITFGIVRNRVKTRRAQVYFTPI